MKPAAMYVRVSTQQQKEEATIESQKSILLEFAREKGFEISSKFIFEDNGVTGSTISRPGLDKLRDLASEEIFEHVFVLSPDRLSRKYAYQVLLIEEFKKKNIKIHFKSSPPSETPGETLLEQMQGMFAEYERAQIIERTRRGKLHKARNGCVNVLTKAPYGYRYICATAIQPAYFEIHKHEAEVVKTIFNLYVKERLSTRKITEYLLVNQISSPKGNIKWNYNTIRDLLKNSAYRGIAYFGVRGKAEINYARLPDRRARLYGRKAPRRSSQERPSNEWIPIPVPAIISNEVFELAQELRSKNKVLSPRNSKGKNLLQGLISCKKCGYGFTISSSGKNINNKKYYRCNNPSRKACDNRGICTEELDQAVWSSLIEALNHPELIQKEISKRLLELKSEPIMERQEILKKKIAVLNHESNRLLDAYQEGCIILSELKTRMSEIKKKINTYNQDLSTELSGLNQKQLLELNTAVSFFSKRLKDSYETLSIEEKRKILRILIKEILIGKEGITINHILPIQQNSHADQNARLCAYHPNAVFA